MNKKDTQELEKVLKSTHINEFDNFRKENKENLVDEKYAFYNYFRDVLSSKKIKQQTVFLNADIPERFGYKILSGEKHTKQRDTILRLCYAAEFTFEETQKALEKYKMPLLYPRIERDALLIIIFNKRPGNIIEVNKLLQKNKQEPLRSSGTQEWRFTTVSGATYL